MKIVVVFIIALFGVAQPYSNDEFIDQTERYHQICLDRCGAPSYLVDAFRRGEFVEDERLSVYARCMFEQHGYVNSYGELQLQIIKNHIPDYINYEQAVRVIERCRDIGDSFEVYRCYRQSGTHPLRF